MVVLRVMLDAFTDGRLLLGPKFPYTVRRKTLGSCAIDLHTPVLCKSAEPGAWVSCLMHVTVMQSIDHHQIIQALWSPLGRLEQVPC